MGVGGVGDPERAGAGDGLLVAGDAGELQAKPATKPSTNNIRAGYVQMYSGFIDPSSQIRLAVI